MKKIIPALILSTLVFAGCSSDKDPNEEDKVVEENQEEVVQEQEETEVENENKGQEVEGPVQEESDSVALFVYRSNADATDIVEEVITHEFTDEEEFEENKFKIVFDYLKQEPTDESIYVTVPEAVELISAKVEDDTLILNFNEEVYNVGGSTGEILFVDSVNKAMFSNAPDIEKIVYQVDGENIEHLSHLSVEEGFTRE